MNSVSYLLLISLTIFVSVREIIMPSNQQIAIEVKRMDAVYKVTKLHEPIKIDANWDKPQWKNVEIIQIDKYMGTISDFKPQVEAKMAYDQDNVYVIFQVKDRFVRSLVQEINGPVSEDSCVEFFFSPDTDAPLKYFNLEINAGGTPLMFYVVKPWSDFKKLEADEIRKIEIAHSLPSKIDPEIAEPVSWTIEYRIPVSVLDKYSAVSHPAPGVVWKANFYKTGSKTSNPNYLTWSFVDHPRPNFHLPQFFGTLQFQ